MGTSEPEQGTPSTPTGTYKESYEDHLRVRTNALISYLTSSDKLQTMTVDHACEYAKILIEDCPENEDKNKWFGVVMEELAEATQTRKNRSQP